jgi:HPt (histidine-containing phosphotransfer) domain-containing protein
MNAASHRRTIVDHEVRGGAVTPVSFGRSEQRRIGQRCLDPRLAGLFERLSGDENLLYLSARVENYAQLTEARMEALRGALAAGEAGTVAVVAHALTDSATRIGAIKMMKLGISLQMLGRRNLMDAAARVFAELEQEYGEFKQNLICEWR